MRRLPYATGQLLRRVAGGSLILAGAAVVLSHLPGWLWLVAAGAFTVWLGYLLLRDAQ